MPRAWPREREVKASGVPSQAAGSSRRNLMGCGGGGVTFSSAPSSKHRPPPPQCAGRFLLPYPPPKIPPLSSLYIIIIIIIIIQHALYALDVLVGSGEIRLFDALVVGQGALPLAVGEKPLIGKVEKGGGCFWLIRKPLIYGGKGRGVFGQSKNAD